MSGLEIPAALPAALAVAGAVGGTATSLVGRQMRGQEESRAAAFEEEQLRTQAQMTRTAAAQDEANRREELTSSLETIAAVRAGRGIGGTSPTGQAITENLIGDTEDDIRASRLTALTRADQSRMASEMAGRRRRMSLIAADVGSAADIFSGIGRVASIYDRGGRAQTG